MIAIGTRVTHFDGSSHTHGLGTVVAYNKRVPNGYIMESNKLNDAAEIAAAEGLLGALVESFYDGERYPYVVQFDSGYKDVYSEDSLTVVK